MKRQPLYYKAGKLNPHWYEQGAMKAARNARFRLIPAQVRAHVIAAARDGVLPSRSRPQPPRSNGHREPEPVQRTESVTERQSPYAPSDKQVNYYRSLVASPVFTPEEKERLGNAHYAPRLSMQFHWENRPARPFDDFDDYLSTFRSRNRKQVRKERAAAARGNLQAPDTPAIDELRPLFMESVSCEVARLKRGRKLIAVAAVACGQAVEDATADAGRREAMRRRKGGRRMIKWV